MPKRVQITLVEADIGVKFALTGPPGPSGPQGVPGGVMQTGFRFYGGRLQSWDLIGRPTIWVTAGQRLKVNDQTGEIKIE